MNYDVEEYVHYQIANARVHAYPFPHFYLRSVFPDRFYERILEALPDTEALTPIHESGAISEVDASTGERRKSAFTPRYLGDVGVLEAEEEAALGAQGGAWRSLAAWMLGDRFRDLIVSKFLPGIQARFGAQTRLKTEVEVRFVRDMTDYSIAPHTDKPDKLVSLLFYLPADASIHELGTSLYVPKDPAFRCDGSVRHPFELFRKVMTAPFLPNSLFGFVKTDQAFHGVEVIERPAVERNLLLYNIYVRKLMRPAPAQGA